MMSNNPIDSRQGNQDDPFGQIHVPTPGALGGWNFPSYGSSGGIDYAGDCVLNQVFVVVVGYGTVTIPVLYGGGATGHTWIALLQHIDPVTSLVVTDQTLTGNVGNPVSFVVAGGPCDHWVVISEGTGPCGSNWAGFQGFTWAPA